MMLLPWASAYASNHPIAIIAPLPIEAKPIEALIQNPHKNTARGFEYVSGHIGNTPVILVISGMGKVSTAVIANSLILEFAPRLLMLAGTAGGIQSDLKPGSVLIADKAYAVEHIRNSHQLYSHPLTQQKIPALFHIRNPYRQQIEAVLKQPHPFILKHGIIATSDIFPQSVELIKRLHQLNMTAIELEGSSVAQVCWMFHYPCLIVRGISDDATESTDPKTMMQSRETDQTILLATHNVSTVIAELLQQLN